MNIKKYLIIVLNLIAAHICQAQISINEIAVVNPKVILDEDGDDGDFIELHNASATAINISGWGLTDNSIWNKWVFPTNTVIAPGGKLLVFCDEKNKFLNNGTQPIPSHWETAVYDTAQWQYFLGDTATPNSSWNTTSFTTGSGWFTGKGGFGFGDADDSTITPNVANAVYFRKTFTVTNKADLATALISLDYDDGIAVYINGVFIAQKFLSTSPLTHNTYADGNHEAVLYNNAGVPDTAMINFTNLQNILVNGTNVIAVEVHNSGNTSSDLTGRAWLHFGVISNSNYYSTNNPNWFIPPSFISLNSYLHSNFKIDNFENIQLSNAVGSFVNSINTGITYYGTAIARIPDGNTTTCFTTSFTPASTNATSSCNSGILAPVTFNIQGGHFSFPQSITLSCVTPGVTIRYTTNGDMPTDLSTIYTSALPVNTTRVIKAKAFLTNYISAPVVTNTYLISENVKLPTVCISADSITVARLQSLSYFDQLGSADGTIEIFNINGGTLIYKSDAEVEQHGRGSTFFTPKPMRVTAKKKYGNGEFLLPNFFKDVTYSRFNQFILRNGGNDNLNSHIRDYIGQQAATKIDLLGQATQPTVLFVNGKYLGVFYIKEPQDEGYAQGRLGLHKDSVEVIRKVWTSGFEATAGTMDSFNNLANLVNNNSPAIQPVFNIAATYFDLKNVKDYYAFETYIANTDWLFNNMKLLSANNKKRKWHYVAWDLEWGMNQNVGETDNTVNYLRTDNSLYSGTFNRLMENTSFKRDYINRFADLINTVFLPDSMFALSKKSATDIKPDFVPRMTNLYNVDTNNWKNQLASIDTFFARRPAIVRNNLSAEYAVGDTVVTTLNVNPAGAGTILISTIVPKTYPWKGVYFKGNPINIQAIPNPGYTFSNWTGNALIANTSIDSLYLLLTNNYTFTANFITTTTPASNLIFSEINYNSAIAYNQKDYVEILNQGPKAFNASNYIFKNSVAANSFTLPNNTVLQAGERLVLPSDLLAFRRYNYFVNNYTKPYNFTISNAGDQLNLFRPNGITVQSTITYDDAAPWPLGPDGSGSSLELVSATGVQNSAANWFNGCYGGSPGVAFVFCGPLSINNIQLYGNTAAVGNQLTWSIADNTYARVLDVEHSNNAINWSLLETIVGKEDANSYNYTHNTVATANNYYRIKTVLPNGAFMYSNIIKLNTGTPVQDVLILPNPATNFLHIQSTTSISKVIITNSLGVTVMQANTAANINVQQLPRGLYQVKVITATGTSLHKLILQ